MLLFCLDVISGMGIYENEQLPLGGQRDPDALPPRNMLEATGRTLYVAFCALGRGNSVFAFKAGIMAGTLSFLALMKPSLTCID